MTLLSLIVGIATILAGVISRDMISIGKNKRIRLTRTLKTHHLMKSNYIGISFDSNGRCWNYS